MAATKRPDMNSFSHYRKVVPYLRAKAHVILSTTIVGFILVSCYQYLHLKEGMKIAVVNHQITESLERRPKLAETKVNPYDYVNLINNEDKCKGDVDILLVVAVHPDSFTQRAHIRWTWGKERPTLRTVFLLGNRNDAILNLNFIEENKFHGDLVQGSYTDELNPESSRVVKTMQALNWTLQFCRNAKFLLILDESFYLDAGNLMNFVRKMDARKAMLIGHLKEEEQPNRHPNTANYISFLKYPFVYFPTHIRGATLISQAAIPLLAASMERLEPYMNNSDIFLGNLAMNLGISFRHEGSFHGETSGIVRDLIASPGYGETDDLLLEWRKHHGQYAGRS